MTKVSLHSRSEVPLGKFCADRADRSYMDLSAIALQGLDQAEIQLEKAATRVASAGSPDATGSDSVDLSAEMVALLSAKNQFSVNLQTLKIADEIQASLLDLMA